jgi:uncharacterized membrane protein
MIRSYLLTITIFLLSSVFKANGQTVIEFYNNTGKVLYSSYVAFDSESSSWTSHGWYAIKPYQMKTVSIGNYDGVVYVHANSGSTSWGSGWKFCVDPKNAFDMRFSDSINCTNKREFSQLSVTSGINKYTFNP